MHFSGLQRRKMQFAGSRNAERMPKPSRKASFRTRPEWARISINLVFKYTNIYI